MSRIALFLTMNFMSTPGGNRLRALREYCGRTQMGIELDANLGIGYLQRVESGKVKMPERDTLERILTALKAGYTDRRDILELFGYVVDTPQPNVSEIRWAVGVCEQELQQAVFPAYLLDCGHRLLAWNPLVPRLYNFDRLKRPSPGAAYPSIARALFDPVNGIASLIANPDDFFPAQIRALRYESRLLRGEGWYDTLLAGLVKDLPLFAQYWTPAESAPGSDLIAARPLVPLELHAPGGSTLRFRITSESFAQDRRFRVIYYIPADAEAIQACIRFAEDV